MTSQTCQVVSPRTQSSANFFNEASGVYFDQGINTFVAGTVIHSASMQLVGKSSIEHLLAHCALDAFFNSITRYSAQKCSSTTHLVIRHQIINWADNLRQSTLVLWVSGASACGKSTLAQTMAEYFNMRKQLIGSFFFSGLGDPPTQANGNVLIPTLVYQLMQAFPETRARILKKIAEDPAIFQRDRRAQMLALFCEPLQAFSLKGLLKQFLGKRPRVFVIDGLDQCDDSSVQCDIIRILAEVAITCRPPLRFIIFSRPEPHLEQTFASAFAERSITRINLDPNETMTSPTETQQIHSVQEEPSPRKELFGFRVRDLFQSKLLNRHPQEDPLVACSRITSRSTTTSATTNTTVVSTLFSDNQSARSSATSLFVSCDSNESAN